MQVDGYCERLDPSFWAEPVNALTNLAFLAAAALMWGRASGLPLARMLVAVLAAIGLGSFLFHSFATVWAGVADVLPIGVFVALYIFAACRDFIGLRDGWAFVGALALFGLVVGIAAVLSAAAPALGANASYIAVDLMILGVGIALLARDRRLGLGLIGGAALLAVSITARMLDMVLCDIWPVGTHFLWHMINAAMLAWMIEVYRRHMLAGAAARG